MKYLKRFENKSINKNKEMFEDFFDCFIDLIDNDPNFDKETNVFFDIKRNDKEEYISPFVEELLNDDEFIRYNRFFVLKYVGLEVLV
jgi:hypothetical protein